MRCNMYSNFDVKMLKVKVTGKRLKCVKKLSYHKQIARQLRTQYVEGNS